MKIAIFDSGIGGFTVLAPFVKEAQKRNLNFEITYLGDLANLPYGTKSPEQIRSLTHESLKTLQEILQEQLSNNFLMLIACNTASALALDVAKESFIRFPLTTVHGVIEAGCQEAKTLAEIAGGRVVVLGTHATINTHVHQKSLLAEGFVGKIVERACPLFVPMVEEHLFQGPLTELGLAHYLDSILEAKDHVILGCTHYPFLREAMEKKYPQCVFIDPGEALTRKLFRTLNFSTQSQALAWKLRALFTDDTMTSERMHSLIKSLGLEFLHPQIELVLQKSTFSSRKN